jgi:hypothetical protein
MAAAEMALTAIALQGDGGISADPVQPGVWVCGGDGDGRDPWVVLVDFFRNLDLSSCLAGLPSAQDCGQCAQVSTCTYDPTDPVQVQQNPASRAFVGPDGNEWVYGYLQPLNAVVLAEQSVSPTIFDLIVFYNETIFDSGPPPTSGVTPCVPECGCQPGDAATD